MRTYTYTYQDSEGLRHEGEVQAKDKDEAYKTLRERGIRPMKVVEKIVPVVKKGIKGLRKRDVGVIAISVAVVTLIVSATCFVLGGRHTVQKEADIALPRHIVAMPSAEELVVIFPNKSHRALACYAIPGAKIEDEVTITAAEVLKPIAILKDDSQDVIELKRIVIGMQQDARRYLSQENGEEKYMTFLNERQEMEHLRFVDTLKRVAAKEISIAEGNVILRRMGLQSHD